MRLCSYPTWGTRPSSPPSRRLPSCRDLSEAPASPHPCGPELVPGVSSCSPHCPAVQRLCQGAHNGLSCLGLGIAGARNLVQDEAVGTWEETVNSSAWLLPQGVCLSAHVCAQEVCVCGCRHVSVCVSIPSKAGDTPPPMWFPLCAGSIGPQGLRGEVGLPGIKGELGAGTRGRGQYLRDAAHSRRRSGAQRVWWTHQPPAQADRCVRGRGSQDGGGA